LLLRIGVREIHASINPAHAASIAVAERLGLKRTAEIADGEMIWKRVYRSATDPARGSG
jgi:RimJ/RimL family protein N-acetyltransferase